jgi:hypothetical protein
MGAISAQLYAGRSETKPMIELLNWEALGQGVRSFTRRREL